MVRIERNHLIFISVRACWVSDVAAARMPTIFLCKHTTCEVNARVNKIQYKLWLIKFYKNRICIVCAALAPSPSIIIMVSEQRVAANQSCADVIFLDFDFYLFHCRTRCAGMTGDRSRCLLRCTHVQYISFYYFLLIFYQFILIKRNVRHTPRGMLVVRSILQMTAEMKFGTLFHWRSYAAIYRVEGRADGRGDGACFEMRAIRPEYQSSKKFSSEELLRLCTRHKLKPVAPLTITEEMDSDTR